jgi:hypothetical protein
VTARARDGGEQGGLGELRRAGGLKFETLKKLSFTHSAIYLTLLVVWIVPGLHTLEFIFGMAHGLGWIAMCFLTLAAVRARVIPLRLGIAVAVIGAVGPFVGSYEFVREERRRVSGLSRAGT